MRAKKTPAHRNQHQRNRGLLSFKFSKIPEYSEKRQKTGLKSLLRQKVLKGCAIGHRFCHDFFGFLYSLFGNIKIYMGNIV